MMFEIDIQIDEPFQNDVTSAQLMQAAQQSLSACGATEGALSILVTTAEAVQALNRQFRGVDAPTDVLSFGTEADDGFFAPQDVPYLGDIVIAAPVARRQAAAMGHTPAAEMMLLTIHGVLHLLGYDHHTPAEKNEMWRKQAEILTACGLAHVTPTEEA